MVGDVEREGHTSAAARCEGFDLVETIDDMLHGLCQPLTVLQCRLALGQLDGGVEAMREAIAEAMTECTRMTRSVATMREALAGMAAAGQ